MPSNKDLELQVVKYCQYLLKAIQVTEQKRYTLEELLNNDQIRSKIINRLEHREGAYANHQLVQTLMFDLASQIARCFFDESKKVASLLNLYRKASHPATQTRLFMKHKKISETWKKNAVVEGVNEVWLNQVLERWSDQEQKEFEEDFKSTWSELEVAVSKINKDPFSRKIVDLRNSYLAHFDMSPLNRQEVKPFDVKALELTPNDMFAFLDRYVPVVYEFTRIVTGTIHDAEECRERLKRQSRDYWYSILQIQVE